MQAKVSRQEFISVWNKYGSAAEVAKRLDISERSVHNRRRRIEKDSNQPLVTNNERAKAFAHLQPIQTSLNRVELGILDQTIIVFSDAHFWPGEYTTAYRGLLWAIKELKPYAVISNGDAFDGASISRHDPLGWSKTPSVIEELKAVQTHLGEIEETAKAARHNCKLLFTWGNHDSRFANKLVSQAPQYREVHGFKLQDHLPAWEFAWSVWPTKDCIIKHRYRSGVHAAHNNTVNAGISIVTGHLHSLKVTPFADYNGNRYGVDTGTLAEPYGPQFEYGEDNPLNHRSGFAVLTFKDGRILWPELVHKWADDQVEFRGQIINV
jgi:DNA-binding Lrp family transcriptional regulator